MTVAYTMALECDECGVQSPRFRADSADTEMDTLHDLYTYAAQFGWTRDIHPLKDLCPLCAARTRQRVNADTECADAIAGDAA